jgi:hypothetical protein
LRGFGEVGVKTSEERNLEFRAQGAGVECAADLGPCGRSGMALEIRRELVALESRRDRARLNTRLIGNDSLPVENEAGDL